jgi:hypothetical protein
MALTGVEVFRESFQRAYGLLKSELRDLTAEQMVWRPAATANSIAFLAWHTPRTGDVYFCQRLMGKPEVWFSQNWAGRIAVEAAGKGLRGLGMGTGFSDEQAGDMPLLPPEPYLAYIDAVAAEVDGYLAGLSPDALEQEVHAEGWPDAKLIAVLFQALNHIHGHRGEVGYIKGLQGIRGRA